MLDESVTEKVLRRALRDGGEFAEVFAESRKSYTLRLEEGKVEENSTGRETGAGVRVVYGESTAYAYTDDLSEGSLMEAAAAAAAAARGRAGGASVDLTAGARPEEAELLPPERPPEEVPREEKLELASRADKAARRQGPEVVQVIVALGESRQRVFVASSDGRRLEDERVRVRMLVQAVAARGGEIQTGYEAPGMLGGYELFRRHDPGELGAAAARQALTMLEARPAPSGPFPVIIANGTGGVLFHEACGHGLEADAVFKRASVFAGKLGEKVASELVFAYDDPTLPGIWGSYRLDDEGTPASRTPLIEEGVLRSYLNDLKRARRDGAAPTGNGRRQSYRHPPIPRMSNTFIAPGGLSPDEIFSDTPRGIYARKLGGGEVNPVTGDFIFAVTEGYLVEGGRLGDPIRGATLIGNGPRVLELIDAVADDLDFDAGMCGKDGQSVPVSTGQPTLRVREMVVGGTAEAG